MKKFQHFTNNEIISINSYEKKLFPDDLFKVWIVTVI